MAITKSFALAGILAAGLTATAANAAAILNFDQAGASSPGGTISFNGSIVTGTNIGFDLVTVSGAPQNNGTYNCATSDGASAARCLLNFTSPTLNNVGSGTWVHNGSGGSATITGTLVDGSNSVIAVSPLVFNGIFKDFTLTRVGSTGGILAFGTDNKDPRLIEYFDLNTDFKMVTSAFSLTGCSGTSTNFTCAVQQADFTNTVPEPASLALLGLGLAGVGVAARKGRKQGA